MNSVEKNVILGELYDYYKNLLTQKQCQYFELYFFEDLTYQEIAQEFGISKTAIHDSISKTIMLLTDFENKLKLNEKSKNLKSQLDKLKNNRITLTEFASSIEGEN